MVVGDDEAGGIDDEAGAEGVDGALAIAALAALALEELIEEILEGEPSGTCGIGAWSSVFTFCEVDMLTTASSSPAARSATDSGPCCATGAFVCGSANEGSDTEFIMSAALAASVTVRRKEARMDKPMGSSRLGVARRRKTDRQEVVRAGACGSCGIASSPDFHRTM